MTCLLRNNEIICLIGKSGSGKDTILSHIKQWGTYKPIISYTTRPIRENERNGREYHFIDKQIMLDFIDNDELVEYRTYDTCSGGVQDTWYYSILKSSVADDEKYVVILDIGGFLDFKRCFGNRVKGIYIDVPKDLREERARERGSFCADEWNRRLVDDDEKFNDDVVMRECDYFVENINFNDAIANIKMFLKIFEGIVYVAHPYDGNADNVARAALVSSWLNNVHGLATISPLQESRGREMALSEFGWVQNGLRQLELCPTMALCVPWARSVGCSLEYKYAREHGKHIVEIVAFGNSWKFRI